LIAFIIFFSLVLATLFLLKEYSKKDLRNYIKTKIITPFISDLFPMLNYKK